MMPGTHYPRFLLAGNSPYANRGNEAIVRGTVEVLSSRFPDARFVLCSFGSGSHEDAEAETDSRIEHRPHVYCTKGIRRFSPEWWSYRVIHKRSPKFLLRRQFTAQLAAMKHADCALLLGGDTFSLYYEKPTWLAGMYEILLSTGKPVVLWGCSVGPFTEDPEFETLARGLLSRMSLILAREAETVSYLASIGIESNVRFVADPAFVMPPRKPDLPEDISQFIEQHPLGLNLSGIVGDFASRDRGQWVRLARECIAALVDAGIAPVLLVPHVMMPTDNNNDHDFLVEAAQTLPGWGDRLRILPPTLAAAEYKWVISRLQAFAGARTHTTVASLSSGIPTISIGYSVKARGINQDIFGHQGWVLPISQVTPAALLEKVREVLAHADEIRAELGSAVPVMQARAMSAGEHIATVIEHSQGSR